MNSYTEISIVTGTYNRLSHLQKMVASARKSIGVGVPYEFVIVDGGSIDGTQVWCKEQKDIVLIEQKKLLGAVKAFNAGCKAACGRYVILANDDIEFIDYSILSALSYMQDNPLVGIGCFYQDRGERDWHVSAMSAIVGDYLTTVYYGQVCIVQRWLGDKVGWWGDYLYTYGGDNELSCNVLEIGYKVEPIPCAFIHDSIPADGLREINNQKMMKGNSHPDTEAWLAKWKSKNNIPGPRVKAYPDDPVELDKYIRFFYMPIFEPGYPIQKQTKHGLRDALANVGLVAECDYLSLGVQEILYMACCFDPHVFITQFQDYDKAELFAELKRQHPSAIFVNWNGDYHPETLLSYKYMKLMENFDLVGLVTTSIGEQYNQAGIKWFYWQIGYERVVDYVIAKRHDVVFQANGYSRERLELATKLRGLRGVDVGIYGTWPDYIRANGNTLYDFATGNALYKNSKIAIGDSQWPSATGFVSNRLFQALYANTLLLHQYFDGMEELLGLVPGKHLVVWLGWEDLQDKIRYYLSHEEERKKIAYEGWEFVEANHSFEVRVEELLRRIDV